jgi:1,4-alpha-glucan branching enzyme
MRSGAFTFILHSHIPYCRQAGRWPHGEEWLHQAAADTYLPLLDALYALRDEGCAYRLTLGLTPVLAEQLADLLVLEHLAAFLAEQQARAEADTRRFPAGDPRTQLAPWYANHYRGLQKTLQRFNGDLIGAFRKLQDEGYIEIITSAATHGYLPLLSRDSSIHGQVATGVQSYQRLFGRKPRAIWLPECAYRPGYYVDGPDGRSERLGLESFLADLGLGCFFAETHTVEGGTPVGKAAGDAVGPYGDIPRRYLVPIPGYQPPTRKTSYRPYWVQTPEVAVFGRNARTGLQVWSAENGYPGDFAYREFHKRDGGSGLNYWRVTGARIDLGDKDFYNPGQAFDRVAGHAEHFAGLVEGLLHSFQADTREYGIVAAAYDTELFGHWWFEGVEWLKQVLRRLAASEVVELTTASAYLELHPPEDVLALPEGSWGQAGNHFTWLNVDTEWMWPLIHEAERQIERLVARHTAAGGARREILAQAARELLLLQSSDWPFLVTTGQAGEYATDRFRSHLERFNRLAGLAEATELNPADYLWLAEVSEADNLFPDIDYRVFGEREGQISFI